MPKIFENINPTELEEFFYSALLLDVTLKVNDITATSHEKENQAQQIDNELKKLFHYFLGIEQDDDMYTKVKSLTSDQSQLLAKKVIFFQDFFIHQSLVRVSKLWYAGAPTRDISIHNAMVDCYKTLILKKELIDLIKKITLLKESGAYKKATEYASLGALLEMRKIITKQHETANIAVEFSSNPAHKALQERINQIHSLLNQLFLTFSEQDDLDIISFLAVNQPKEWRIQLNAYCLSHANPVVREAFNLFRTVVVDEVTLRFIRNSSDPKRKEDMNVFADQIARGYNCAFMLIQALAELGLVHGIKPCTARFESARNLIAKTDASIEDIKSTLERRLVVTKYQEINPISVSLESVAQTADSNSDVRTKHQA